MSKIKITVKETEAVRVLFLAHPAGFGFVPHTHFCSISLSHDASCPVAGCRDAASRADATSVLVVALHWGAPGGHL